MNKSGKNGSNMEPRHLSAKLRPSWNLAALTLMVALCALPAAAVNYASAGGSPTWQNPGAWIPNGVPVAGDSVTINPGTVISLSGAPSFACDNLTINGSGRLDGQGGTLTITGGGTFARTGAGGAGFNAQGSTVIFAAGGSIANQTPPLTFNNLTINGVVDVQGNVGIQTTGILTNNGTIRSSLAIGGTGSYALGIVGSTGAFAAITVTSQGTLSNLQVDIIDSDHPNATGYLLTGRYWVITPTGSGYTVDLTLPDNVSDPYLARWNGSSWDAPARTTDNGGSVKLESITALSDWTISDGAAIPISPTAPALLNTNGTTDSGDDFEPQITTDGGGNWVATWESSENLGGTAGTDYDIFVARSTDNGATWTAPALLNTNGTTDSGHDHHPQITTDGGGNWIATWESSENLGGTAGIDVDIFVARSTDNGATWTAPALLNTNATTDSGYDDFPQITTDGGGNWVATWYSNENLGGTAGIELDIFVARFVIPLTPVIGAILNATPNDGAAYSETPTLSQGTAPITWTITAPVSPPGDMAINSGTGEVTWTADLADSPVNMTIEASGPGGTDTESWSITVQDVTPPVVSSITRMNLIPTRLASVDYLVTFSENVTGVDTGDFSLHTTGAVSGASVSGVSGSGSTRTVTIGTGSGDGTIRLDVQDNDTILDVASNPLGGTGAGNGDYAAGATYTIDKSPPTLSIGAPSATDTNTGPVTYTVTYAGADAVTLANGNVTLNTTGDATGSVNVTGSGTATRTVTISGIGGDGTLGISIAADTASDAVGNSAGSAGPSAIFTVDNTAPTLSIGAPSTSTTGAGPVTYTVTYTDANSVTLVGGDVTLNTTGDATGSVLVSGSGTNTRTVTVSSISGDGTLGISIAADTASDAAGNSADGAGPSATFTVESTVDSDGDGVSDQDEVDVHGSNPNRYEVWVDFAHQGTESGLPGEPYNTLAEALAVAPLGCGIIINGASSATESSWTGSITTAMYLEANPAGSVRIGVLGAKSLSEDKTSLAKILDALQSALGTGNAEGEASLASEDEAGLVSALSGSRTTYEPVVPFTRVHETLLAAQADSTLAVRLRSDADIDPNTIWGPVMPGEAVVEWKPAQDDMRDVWVVFRPQETWYLEDTISLTAGAVTVEGEPVGPVTHQFHVESEADYEARTVTPPETIWQPRYAEDVAPPDNDQTIEPSDAAVVGPTDDETPSLSEGIEAPFAIGPEQVYDVPQRVWLPIPPEVDPNDVALFYYHPNGEDKGWYPAENVEGWLVPDSYLHLEVDGTTYLGFLVRHAGIVQLGRPAE